MKHPCIACALCLALLLTGCGQGSGNRVNSSGGADGGAAESVVSSGAEDGVSIDYGNSEQFSQQDMDAAIDVIQSEFATWDGCVLHSLAFHGDETGNDYLEEYNRWGDPTYEECIVFDSAFHSPVEEQDGTALEADSEYTGWSWYLMRDSGGPWVLVTWGVG